MKRTKVLFAIILCAFSFFSCEKGLVYDEVPESVYNNVSLTGNLCRVEARELFTHKVWQVNYNQWAENMISTTHIGEAYHAGADYTNNTDAAITILGETLSPGESMFVKNTMTTADEASAPDGKVYILNVFANANATYTTPNKGHLFVESEFANDPIKPILVEPEDGMARSIILPSDPKRLIVGILLENSYACKVERIEDAPELGKPGDFSVPRRYMVVNTTKRPDKQPAAKRLYEIRVQLLK